MDAYHCLLYLTFLYLAILVIALAAGLIAIARALIITRKNLASIHAGLAQVEAQTRPLLAAALGFSLRVSFRTRVHDQDHGPGDGSICCFVTGLGGTVCTFRVSFALRRRVNSAKAFFCSTVLPSCRCACES